MDIGSQKRVIIVEHESLTPSIGRAHSENADQRTARTSERDNIDR
jgi:hypothetical protein